MSRPGIVIVVAALAISIPTLHADQLNIDFEGPPDSTPITTDFPGVVFSNAAIISAGASLNEAEFPPHSGSNVALDNGGPMTLTFLSPLLSFDGFFTYAEGLTLAAFDQSNSPLPVVTSAFSANYVSSGNSPNEELSVGSAGGISRVVITGDPSGSSFVVDDITLTFAPTEEAQVPEPASFVLLGAVVMFLLLVSRPVRLVASRESRRG